MRLISILFAALVSLAACSAPLTPCECLDTPAYNREDAYDVTKYATGSRLEYLRCPADLGFHALPDMHEGDTAHVECCLPGIYLAPTCEDTIAALAACDAYVVVGP